jgi:hypothetical protein
VLRVPFRMPSPASLPILNDNAMLREAVRRTLLLTRDLKLVQATKRKDKYQDIQRQIHCRGEEVHAHHVPTSL